MSRLHDQRVATRPHEPSSDPGPEMKISFDDLRVGEAYDRPFLADLWGYSGFQALSRGVVTPSGTNYIILFVTKEKQGALTQYDDYLDGSTLRWEGELGHGTDERIVKAAHTGSEVHLFYRDIHHSPFTYYGQVILQDFKLKADAPSQFAFFVEHGIQVPDPIDDVSTHREEFESLPKTERDAIVKSRIGQGEFRKRLINLWGGCSVTGLNNLALLRASHIKPWRHCTNSERLDPLNGLLLHPALDHVFDAGLATFTQVGKIRLSTKLSNDDLRILCIDPGWTLKRFPRGLDNYLAYHRERVFV